MTDTSPLEDYTSRKQWWALEGRAGLYVREGVVALFATKEEAEEEAEGGDLPVKIHIGYQHPADQMKKLRAEVSKAVHGQIKLTARIEALEQKQEV